MGMVKKSITVTDQQNEWIKSQIESGHYGSDSEVFRDLIRQRQARNAEMDAIRGALIDAEQSGFSDKTVEEIRLESRKRLKTNGHL